MTQRTTRLQTSVIGTMLFVFGILFAVLLLGCLTGCATWYISDEERAEMAARRSGPVRNCERVGEFGDLFCKDIAPEPGCMKLGDYIYDCTDLAKADKAFGF